MKRREILALIIFFAMTTAGLTPTAYRLGVSHSAAFAAQIPQGGPVLSENGAERLVGQRRVSVTDCPALGPPAGIARPPGVQIDCLPAHAGQAAAIAEPKRNDGNGNLSRALVAAIADGPTNAAGAADTTPASTGREGAGEAEIGSPINLALAPDGANGSSGKPGLFPNGGLPNSLIPVGLAPLLGPPGQDPPENPIGGPIDDPFDDMPDVVVPVPPGIALMFTGLIGFFAALRKK